MNTGFLRHAVATVLTVYGIETFDEFSVTISFKLQQCLPFTVLKLSYNKITINISTRIVATVLTVYGIETVYRRQQRL